MSAPYPGLGVYVAAIVVLLSAIVPNPASLDTCTTYVSPSPVHVNAGVVSFVSAKSAGDVKPTVTEVSTITRRAAVVS